MSRWPGVDDGPRSAMYGDIPAFGNGAPAPPAGGQERGSRSGKPWRSAGRPWNGAGGRWLIWVFRAVVWAALLIIGYRGVMAIVLSEMPASRSGTPAASARPQGAAGHAGFPAALAEAYAMQFGDVYLNASPATASERAKLLAAFLPGNLASADPQLGWNGSGELRLQSEQVAGISVTDSRHAVVRLLAEVNGSLMELGVPIYAADGGMVVSGEPAWLAAPAHISLPASPAPVSDASASSVLVSQLPAFFQAYASGDSATLNRFLTRGASVTGLGDTVRYGGITGLHVPPGGAVRNITVTVIWQLAGQASAKAAKLEMTYDMTVVEQSGKWYVEDIHASTQGVQGAGGS